MDAVDDKIYALVDYEDSYVQPLLLAALKSRLPPEVLVLIDSQANENQQTLPKSSRLLQWRQYESIDFDHVTANTSMSLANSYIIRKALIRKHYLSNTVAHWITKHPTSVLTVHVKPAVEFEVDYAEFLDDALDQAEAWELRESWQKNAEIEEGAKEGKTEWWILKPGMSDRGQGIRLFSSETELQEIFEDWDPHSSDEEDQHDADSDTEDDVLPNVHHVEKEQSNGIMTSHLRHFIAQPYIHPPLLLPAAHPSAGRKFHIRTYVLAVGALRLYVFKRMLALFAAESYQSPADSVNHTLSAHLTNTCLQSGEREGSVCEFSSLPVQVNDIEDWQTSIFDQICTVTGETFEAAARTMSIHFQPLPNAFEVFGLDFLVDAEGVAWLLEVNAFPDFAQTGDELRGLVRELFEGIVDVAVAPFFSVASKETWGQDSFVQVLDIDLGRR